MLLYAYSKYTCPYLVTVEKDGWNVEHGKQAIENNRHENKKVTW